MANKFGEDCFDHSLNKKTSEWDLDWKVEFLYAELHGNFTSYELIEIGEHMKKYGYCYDKGK